MRLLLASLAFDRVEFTLLDDDGRKLRPVVVLVGSGRSWQAAARFPTIGTDATASTGDDDLDREVRERAAEELTRLDAAVRAAQAEAAA